MGGVFKIAEKGLYVPSFTCSGSLLLSFADSTGALQCASEGTKYLEGEGGGFSFTTVFFIMSTRQPECGLLPKADLFPGSCLSVLLQDCLD